MESVDFLLESELEPSFTDTMYRGIRPFKFIYGKNDKSSSHNGTIKFKMEENEGVDWFFNVFSIDELEGSYSPVHGDAYLLVYCGIHQAGQVSSGYPCRYCSMKSV